MTENSRVKKPQKLVIQVDPEFGEIALGEIRNALFRRYSLWNKVKPVEAFPGDPFSEVEVLFYATDEKTAEIEAALGYAYEF